MVLKRFFVFAISAAILSFQRAVAVVGSALALAADVFAYAFPAATPLWRAAVAPAVDHRAEYAVARRQDESYLERRLARLRPQPKFLAVPI